MMGDQNFEAAIVIQNALYSLTAFNSAHASENKIHSDDVAQLYGFKGGLVPGVDVYAYMCRAMMGQYGPSFLRDGRAEVRFAKPVYDGQTVYVSLRHDKSPQLDIELYNDQELCAVGQARMRDVGPDRPTVPEIPTADLPPMDKRPKLPEAQMEAGKVLGTLRETFGQEQHLEYLQQISETDEFYADEGVVHPGYMLRQANMILKQNYEIGAWIHVGSVIDHHDQARVGDIIETRAQVVLDYERRGAQFAELNVNILAGENRVPCMAVRHIIIYRPRQKKK